MDVDVSLTVLIEAPDPAEAEKVVTTLVDRMGQPVAARRPVVDEPRFPGSWLTMIKLAPMSREDAAAAVHELVERLGAPDWTFEVAEPLHASASWDPRFSASPFVEPQVTWAHLLASWNDPDEEPFEPEELEPDEPAVN